MCFFFHFILFHSPFYNLIFSYKQTWLTPNPLNSTFITLHYFLLITNIYNSLIHQIFMKIRKFHSLKICKFFIIIIIQARSPACCSRSTTPTSFICWRTRPPSRARLVINPFYLSWSRQKVSILTMNNSSTNLFPVLYSRYKYVLYLSLTPWNFVYLAVQCASYSLLLNANWILLTCVMASPTR